ncbi:MAG: autotransporter domain-containing protein [Alphaproteobacteria bacterium]|nr:autotransporter domain-containing protein [Alphaproteobacteria bacterium]
MLTHCVLPRFNPTLARALAASTAILLALASNPAAAQAVFIVDTDTTVTNGDAANVLDGADQIIVTESGSITTSGVGEEGISANGPDNIIQVDGSIRTEGTGSAYGILSLGDDAQITINGSVVTTVSGQGVEIRGANTTVVNNGSVTARKSQAMFFLSAATDSTLINTGRIMTTDDGIQAVIFRSAGTVINSGTIMASSSFSETVEMTGGGILENTGTILATGLNGEAVLVRDGVIVTNSGRIISQRGPAIDAGAFSDADDTFNLLAPGFIGGTIDLGTRNIGGTETVINILTGQSHSIFWTLEGDTTDWTGGAPDISGSVPWFYNAAAQTVATFDPTLLASETDALGDLTSMLSHVGLGALEGFEPGPGPDTGFSALGYMPVADGEADTATQRVGRAWATALGGQMDHEGGGTTLDNTIGHIGIAAGYTWQQAPDLIVNAMAGYVAGNNKADANWAPSFDHDTHTLFAGLHGEHQLNRAAVQFGLTAGHSWIDHNRFVNDNLAPLGESWVSADYGGFFVSPELALSTDILLENGLTLTPNAGVRYAAQWLGGYAETGAVSPAANATVEDRFVGTVEARAGLDVTRSFDIRGRTGTLTGGIGYLGRWGGGDDDVSITLNGVTQSVASGHQDLNAVMVSATLLSDIGETGFLELDANYLVGDTAQGFDGRLTMGMAF